MSPSLKTMKPERVVARFGSRNNPLFLVEKTEEDSTFIIRDADQGLDEHARRLGLVEVEHIDPENHQVDVGVELNEQGAEAAYNMLPGDIVAAIGAVAKESDASEVKLTDSNLPAYILERVVGNAEIRSADSSVEPFEFEIAA